MKTCSGKQFCKILEQHGWILVRINGSHHVFRKIGEKFAISVPVHKNVDLKIGIQKDLMKKAGLREEDIF
jgi:predicted RNA binding protein YcfA (HicA-like mRNA interferase family)